MRRILILFVTGVMVAIVATPALAMAEVDHQINNYEGCTVEDITSGVLETCWDNRFMVHWVQTPSGNWIYFHKAAIEVDYVYAYDDGTQRLVSHSRDLHEQSMVKNGEPHVMRWVEQIEEIDSENGTCVIYELAYVHTFVNGKVISFDFTEETGPC